MSGLWDFDDDVDDLDDNENWNASPTMEDDIEGMGTKKRKAGNKPGPQSKRRQGSPTATTAPPKAEIVDVVLLDASDDEDDLLVLGSPPDKKRSAATSTSDAPSRPQTTNPRGAGAYGNGSVASNLDHATQQALAKEHELLRALQQMTEAQQEDSEDISPQPTPLIPRLPPLALPRPANRIPPHDSGSDDAAMSTGSAGPSTADTSGGAQEDAAVDPHGATAAAATAVADIQLERVRLKLVWDAGKDGNLVMRVVKTDPISKMINKFREIARQRSLCRDANKTKFLLDGDDLNKTPNETPEDLDLEDDVIIDVKF